MRDNLKPSAAAATDYRASHLVRGATYDATLGASFFDHYMAFFEAESLQTIVPTLFPHPPTYIDFACGTGRITRSVAPLSARATGIDISASMLEQARAKCPDVEFLEVDITQDDFRREPVDLVTSFRFFGNAGDELRGAALRAINHLLKPGGFLIMNNHRNPLSLAALLARLGGAPHDTNLTYYRLERRLHEFGFRIVMRRPIGFWLFRARLMFAGDPSAPQYRKLEKRFSASILTPFAPDAVIVATKVSQA